MKKTTKLSIIIVLAVGILGLNFLFKSNNENIESLETFARLYGYVRFFHPSDEAAQIDWNHLAYYGVKKVRQAKNRKQLAKILTELFHPIAPTITIYNSEDKNEFQKQCITPPDTSLMRIITYQHYGVDLGYTSHIYRSVRLNRKNTINLAGWFFHMHQQMPASPCKGKEFILKASIKVERGSAHLFFFEKGSKAEEPGKNTMKDLPINPGQMQYYEIKNKVSPDAKTIHFGFYFKNKIGKALVDDFQLLVKEGDKWVQVPIPDAGFEAGPGKTKAWRIIGTGWDKKIISHAEAKGNYCFSVENITEDVHAPLFPQYPQPEEYIKKDIGSGLSCIVPLSLYGTDTSTYPKAPADKMSKLQAALKKEVPTVFSMKDRNLRFADVIITWNVLQHFYPYFDVVNTDWNKMLAFGLKHTMDDKNERELANTLKMMLAQLKDGHADVNHHKLMETFQLPITCDWIENHLVVTVSNDSEINKGDVVRAIDGTDSKILLAEVEKRCSGSQQYERKKAMRELMPGPQGSDVSIEIERDGKVMKIDSKRTVGHPMREFKRKKIEDLGDGFYFVDLNAISQKDFKDALEKLKIAKGIVFDGRQYIAYELKMVLGYLVDKPIQSPIFGVPEVIYPNREKMIIKEERWEVEPTQPCLTAPCVFLTNGGAASAAETFLSMVKYYKLGEIIGQPTAGVNGDFNSVLLPGNFIVSFTGARTLNHDGSQFHTIGVSPTIPCERTIQGVKEGRDELLEKALEILKKKIKKT